MPKSVLCFGAMHMDKLARCHRPFKAGVSNPVSSEFAVGGVAFNIARNMRLRDVNVSMVSCVGADFYGEFVKSHAADWNIDSSLVAETKEAPTATYTAILDHDGELAAGLSEMDIYAHLTIDALEPKLAEMKSYPLWVIDANLASETIDWLVTHKGESKVLAAPVSVAKAERWKQALPSVDIWIGNGTEAEVLTGIIVKDVQSATRAAQELQKQGPDYVVVTLAAKGVILAGPDILLHRAIPETRVVDVNGAGDSFFAGFTSEIAKDNDVLKAVETGLAVASLTAESSGPVWKDLDESVLKARIKKLPKPTDLAI